MSQDCGFNTKLLATINHSTVAVITGGWSTGRHVRAVKCTVRCMQMPCVVSGNAEHVLPCVNLVAFVAAATVYQAVDSLGVPFVLLLHKTTCKGACHVHTDTAATMVANFPAR